LDKKAAHGAIQVGRLSSFAKNIPTYSSLYNLMLY